MLSYFLDLYLALCHQGFSMATHQQPEHPMKFEGGLQSGTSLSGSNPFLKGASAKSQRSQ